jgi:hypothetical protein
MSFGLQVFLQVIMFLGQLLKISDKTMGHSVDESPLKVSTKKTPRKRNADYRLFRWTATETGRNPGTGTWKTLLFIFEIWIL